MARLLSVAVLILAVALAAGLPGSARAAGATDPGAAGEDLARIQEQIRAVESRVRRETARRSQLDRDLRTAEESAARARRALADVRRQLADARQEQARLVAAADQARRDLETQRKALAAQLRLAHRNGPGARLQVLLSDDDPADASRRIQYLAYLARGRREAVAAVKASLAALEASRREVEAQAEALAALEQTQARELASLEAARRERAGVVAKADQQIKGEGARLKRLRSQAADLERLIRDLERAIAREAARRDGATQPRGKGSDPGKPLPGGRWPVVGRLLADYGQPRAGGQMRWEGVLIGAPAGTAVRATRAGRVVYADWLPGLGLLMVLDHGQGILSLYGHNQELAKAVGDRVTAGETIARVGDTGGQGRPALYFEVRRNGRPQNPHRWVR